MNDMPKVVFFRALRSVDWPETRIAIGDIGQEIAPVMVADRVIRWTTAAVVIGVAAVAAVASYEHAYALVLGHGEAGWTVRLVPLTVDGLIYASSMVMLDAARRKVPVPVLARWLLGLGIAATLAANVVHGLGHGLTGAAVGARPAVALVGSYELLMMIIRSSRALADATAVPGVPDRVPDADQLQVQATQVFAGDLAAGSRAHSGYARTWPPSPTGSGQADRSDVYRRVGAPGTPGSFVTRRDPPTETARASSRRSVSASGPWRRAA